MGGKHNSFRPDEACEPSWTHLVSMAPQRIIILFALDLNRYRTAFIMECSEGLYDYVLRTE